MSNVKLALAALLLLTLVGCSGKAATPATVPTAPPPDPAVLFAAEMARELAEVNEYFGIPRDAVFTIEARNESQQSFSGAAYLTTSEWQRLLPFGKVLELDGASQHCGDKLRQGRVSDYLWDSCSLPLSRPVFTMVAYQVVELRMADVCRFPMTVERVHACKDLLDRFERIRYDDTPVMQLGQLKTFFRAYGPMTGALNAAGIPSLDALNDKIGFYLMKGSGPFEAYHKFITNAAAVLDNRADEKLGAGGH